MFSVAIYFRDYHVGVENQSHSATPRHELLVYRFTVLANTRLPSKTTEQNVL